jgi:Na+-transporting NADH:ubiquinone oxidoreductase subunit F
MAVSYNISINGGDRVCRVPGGASLFKVLAGQGIHLPSVCGGRGLCGKCRVVVRAGVDATPTEKEMKKLGDENLAAGFRLACQIAVNQDMAIEVPEDLLGIRQYAAVCERIRDLSHDIKEFRLKLREPATISFVPGQYVQLQSPAYNATAVETHRAYSISSDPAEKDAIELVIRRVPNGMCTTYCFDYLREGDTVAFTGPYGSFRLSDTAASIIMIAGGSGIAPIKSILHQMQAAGSKRPATFFFGANIPADLVYGDVMREFARTMPTFTFVPVVVTADAVFDGERGLVTEAVDRRCGDLGNHEAYLCGSPGMIDATITVLAKHGMAEPAIFYDKFV